MIYSFLVYSTVFVGLLLLAISSSKKVLSLHHIEEDFRAFWTPENSVSLLLFTLVFGFRYDVGVDYENYAYIYTHSGERSDSLEFLFLAITNLMRDNGISLGFYFSFWSFLQLFFLLYAFRKERYLYPYLIFVLFCGQYFLLWMNVIRQDLATCIFIFAIEFIEKKKFFAFLLWILIASGIHQTALVLLLFYPIFMAKTDYLKHLTVLGQLSILFICLYIHINNYILIDFDRYLNMYMINSDYGGYSYGAVEHTSKDNVIGGTFILSFIVDAIIISYSEKLRNHYSSTKFNIFYTLYFVGVLFELLFGYSYILERSFRYLRFFKLVITPYLLYYLYQKRKKAANVFLLLFVVLAFIASYFAIFSFSEDAKYQYHSILFDI